MIKDWLVVYFLDAKPLLEVFLIIQVFVSFCLTPGIWLPWRANIGQYIESGEIINHSPADNLQDCMSRCLTIFANGKECRAVTITTTLNNICQLHTARTGDVAVASGRKSARQSFDRPTWYSGKRKIINTLSSLNLKQFEWLK